MAIKVHTKTITPAMAKAMLDESQNLGASNRRVSQQHVDLYAEEMRHGRWKLNGVAIKLDEQGAILDGQHRLQACVAAGIPFQTIVMSGVPRDTFDTLDCGRARTTSQVLQMADVKYNALIASIIRGVGELRTDGHTARKEKKMSNTAALAEYNAHSKAYDAAARISAVAVSESHAMTAKLAGSIYYYLTQDLKQSADKVEQFIQGITSFDTASNPVVDKLRKWNLANRTVRISDRTRLGYIILTWNAMVEGSKKAPRFSEAKLEEMPKFKTSK